MRAWGLTDHYREIFEITRLADFMQSQPTKSAPSAAQKGAPMPEATATIDVRGLAGASVVDIDGDVTAGTEDVLMEAYGGERGDVTAVILNFTGLEYMNSGGIGLLVTLLVRANRQGQRLLAFGLSDHYRQIFELTRLDEAVGIHDTEAEALSAAGASEGGP